MNKTRYIAGKKTYFVTDGASEHSFHWNEHIAYGAGIVIDGEVSGTRLDAKSVIILSEEDTKKLHVEIEAKIREDIDKCPSPIMEDKLILELWPRIKETAIKLRCGKLFGRALLLRFHGDADGIAGAFAITEIMRCKALQQNSAVYSIRDALKDIELVGQENMPLVLLVDFGSNKPSQEALKLLKAAGMEYVVIDHHPYDGTAPENTLSPFLVSEDASKYTAGYLCCEIAHLCGMEKERALELTRIAFAGDKSKLLPLDTEDRKKALVLDFLSAHISFGNNLDFYKNVMSKSELFTSIATQADETIEEAAKKALSNSKEHEKGDLKVVTFSLENIAKKGEWPPSSKITTRIFERFMDGKPVVCIGYTDRSIIMRINDSAAEKGLGANKIAAKVLETMGDFVEGGGGHVKAGAIRVKPGFVKEVLSEILRIIEN